MERTFALIKPDAVGKPWTEEVEEKAEEGPDVKVTKTRAGDKSNEILKRIAAAGFTVVSQRLLQLTHAQAADFYAEHAGKPFYEALVAFMSSAPCIALVLERADAVRVWRELMGPTNTGAAFAASQGAHPLNEEAWTLRALFGTDGTRNAVHGSAHAYAVAREAEFFFPAPEVRGGGGVGAGVGGCVCVCERVCGCACVVRCVARCAVRVRVRAWCVCVCACVFVVVAVTRCARACAVRRRTSARWP